jgi:hypothetical protein
MIFSELLTDAINAGDTEGSFRIVLATRTVEREELPAGKVQLSDVGLFQVDDSAGEIDVLPVQYMDAPPACLTVADVIAMLSEHPAMGGYQLTGVDGFKTLADGGNAQKTLPIIGTYALAADCEIWLLQDPKRQWPQHWFGAS